MTGKKTPLSSKSLGNIGEAIAMLELEKKDYRIIERNFNTRMGEVDIIAAAGKILVFIEVKIRTSSAFGSPSESIDPGKVLKIRKAAGRYIARNDSAKFQDYRFDIIAIMAKKNNISKILGKIKHGVISDNDISVMAADLIGSCTIEHIESAF